ncbi:MAG: hypothetical protein DRQ49_04445 [Gammaproteobacteria bacterium]|nr:MAG: hypothetical protein DRQ49_04445 [Gammaproteobacteria bacterium]
MYKSILLTLNAWLLCVFSGSSFSLQLFDRTSFLYDVGSNGVLMQGTRDAYAGLYYLRVNGTDYVGHITHLSPDGREVHSSLFTEPDSGLKIRRQVYVSKTQNFARFSEILFNSTDTPITVDIEIYGQFGTGKYTVAEPKKAHFLITSEVTEVVLSPKPVLLHYHSQVNNPVTATHTLNNRQLSWIYPQVTVPAQSQIRLIYFVAQTTDVAMANQIATEIHTNSSTALYECIELETGDCQQSLNFEPPQASPRDEEDDGDFSQAQVLNVGALWNGVLDTQDAWSLRRNATPADAYSLNLRAGETVTIRMSASFNAYLYLFQDINAETLLATNDDRTANTNHAEIVFNATEDGTYYIEATAYQRKESGSYTLEILAGAINRQPTAYPFDFTAENFTAPATVTLTDFNTDLDGDIVERCWHFNDGSPVTCETTNTVTHTFQAAGQYNVGLTLRDNEDAYAYQSATLFITSPPEESIVLRVSNSIAGELIPSDNYSQTRTHAVTDRYRISSISAGQELVIDMISEDFDSYLYLYDRFNRILHQDNNSGSSTHARLRYTPQNEHDLWIEATTFQDNKLGKYKIALDIADNSAIVDVPIEVSPALDNPLQYLLVARLPHSFEATSLRWDFGDKSEEVMTEQPTISHTYSKAGEFTVILTALNAKSQQLTGNQTLIVNKQSTAPDIRFSANPVSGEKPLRVFFSISNEPNALDEALTYVWQFGDGETETNLSPTHTFTQTGTYHVILQTFTSQQRASYTVPITVLEPDSTELPVTGVIRALPQVLMAGFDPILLDLLDTNVKIFAIVKPGKTPIETVHFRKNSGDFELIMSHIATYPNGDQRYETVFTFEPGTFPVGALSNLFGDKKEQFRIQVIDKVGQFHAFPNLEIGNYPPLAFTPQSLSIKAPHQLGIHRHQPQVLAAGFDPALVHKNDEAPVLINASDAEFMIKAIVREGLFPIQSVTLKQNQGALNLPMRLTEILPNGDQLYVVNYPYPSDTLEKGTWGHLFGIEPTQYTITVKDFSQQTHRFPEVLIGHFPPR